MNRKLAFTSIFTIVLFLVLAPAASASSTWYVDGVNGNDGNDCLSTQTACQTIGHAIALCSSGDTIMVAPAIYTENLYIDINLKIIGSDAATTIVDGNQARVFFIPPFHKAHVRLSRLTIRNGYSPPEGCGGGIYNGGTLTINRSIISGNRGNGGGIFSYHRLTVNNSTISGNSSWGGLCDGGGINNQGLLTMNNSTLSGNSAATGGGINNSYGTLTVNNSTISGNSAAAGGGVDNESGGMVTLQNSIVAKNSGGNCGGGSMTSRGYNLSSDDTCNLTGPGDMNNTDPKLGKLKDNGGPTQTIRLLNGSPAIDAGNPNGCTDDKGTLLKTDQRGWARPGKQDTGACDIGAFERQKD